MRERDAASIVHACDAHDDLVAALESIAEKASRIPGDDPAAALATVVYREARAARAKAGV